MDGKIPEGEKNKNACLQVITYDWFNFTRKKSEPIEISWFDLTRNCKFISRNLNQTNTMKNELVRFSLI